MEKLIGIRAHARFFINIRHIRRGQEFLIFTKENAYYSKKFLFLMLSRLTKKYEQFLKILMEKLRLQPILA